MNASSVSNGAPAPAPKPAAKRPAWLIVLLVLVGILLVAFIGIQLIPVNRTNPAVTTPIKWDSPQTEALARRACLDCHSNETVWPWYSYVAPASWLIYYDVQQGRSMLNLSTYGSPAAGGQRGPNAYAGDLAYQFGQLLAGDSARPGEGRGPGQFPPGGPGGGQGGQAPQNRPTPPAGQTGGQARPGGFGGGRIGEAVDQINNGSMPPAKYTLIHPSATLSAEEKKQLITGLTATFGSAGR